MCSKSVLLLVCHRRASSHFPSFLFVAAVLLNGKDATSSLLFHSFSPLSSGSQKALGQTRRESLHQQSRVLLAFIVHHGSSSLQFVRLAQLHRPESMSDLLDFAVRDDEQQHVQSISFADVLTLSLGNMPEIDFANRTHTNSSLADVPHAFDFTSPTYKIVFGLLCACLCLLTIAGNLLVLITFRHMRTVSKWPMFDSLDRALRQIM